tara:strand:+ start:292 stop:906 length:615 start_codon:yes stop_codon:yes gene_type:complete
MIRVNYIDLGVHEGEEIDLVLDHYKDYKDKFDLSIYGVEANPKLYEDLEQKYKHFDEVKIFNNVISSASGCYIDLYLGKATISSSIFATKSRVTDKTVRVLSHKFSDFVNDNVEEFNTSINVLKLNIEGAELDVYEDLIETDLFKDIDLFCGHPSHDIEKVAELEPKRERYYSLLEEYDIKLSFLCAEGKNKKDESINIFEAVS